MNAEDKDKFSMVIALQMLERVREKKIEEVKRVDRESSGEDGKRGKSRLERILST